MKCKWRRIGRVRLLSIVLLLVSPGIVIVSADEKTTTASTTSHQEEGHQDEEGQNHGAEGHSESRWPTMIGGMFLLGTVATAPIYKYFNRSRQDFTVSSIHLGVVLLALFTVAVHLYLFIENGLLIMLFAGLGFLGGIGLFFIGVNRQYLYLLGIVYTTAQILLWVNDGMPHLSSFGLIDKVVQTFLIIVLGYSYVTQ